jgi:hypothetical protein
MRTSLLKPPSSQAYPRRAAILALSHRIGQSASRFKLLAARFWKKHNA